MRLLKIKNVTSFPDERHVWASLPKAEGLYGISNIEIATIIIDSLIDQCYIIREAKNCVAAVHS